MVNSLYTGKSVQCNEAASVVGADRPLRARNGPKTKLIASRLPASEERLFVKPWWLLDEKDLGINR